MDSPTLPKRFETPCPQEDSDWKCRRRGLSWGMELLEAPRPACMMSGEEAVAVSMRCMPKTLPGRPTASKSWPGWTRPVPQEISGEDTARFVAARHRLNRPEVQRDLKLATALAEYPAVSAALPDVYAPSGPTPQSSTPMLVPSRCPVRLMAPCPAMCFRCCFIPTRSRRSWHRWKRSRRRRWCRWRTCRPLKSRWWQAARNLSSWTLKQLGQRVRAVWTPTDLNPPEEAARQREALRLTTVNHGVKISGFLANRER